MKPRPQHAEIELNFLNLRGAIKTPPELRRVMPLDWQAQGRAIHCKSHLRGSFARLKVKQRQPRKHENVFVAIPAIAR